ncbi:hypothetical protein POTOM_046294 [Populus tomentosa]|uniref:Uncharacterized protein n=1 Tax=Populus tomentosa TaxID=118781 RepID=A0A8X7YEC8_POPTO|nr:hypothetical protein POTOM_046294 [Populus tomentosa]
MVYSANFKEVVLYEFKKWTFNGDRRRTKDVGTYNISATVQRWVKVLLFMICCAKRLPAADYARNKRGSSRKRYSYRSQLKTSAAVVEKKKGAMLGGETVGEGEFESGGETMADSLTKDDKKLAAVGDGSSVGIGAEGGRWRMNGRLLWLVSGWKTQGKRLLQSWLGGSIHASFICCLS